MIRLAAIVKTAKPTAIAGSRIRTALERLGRRPGGVRRFRSGIDVDFGREGAMDMVSRIGRSTRPGG